MFSIDYIKEWSESYKTDLTTNIMPFWLKYGLDKVNGGIYTCVDRDGSLMDTTKSVYSKEDLLLSVPMRIII